MSDIRERQVIELFPMQEPSLAMITDVFDRTDAWLRTGPASYGMKYAESGIDLPFSKESVREHREAMESADEFDKYLSRLAESIDRMMNMDW